MLAVNVVNYAQNGANYGLHDNQAMAFIVGDKIKVGEKVSQ